ncbi:MAG: glycosidase [Calditrichaeota bacterium]|nr:MAG: glycosidase [Calditrichota bacterium]
MNNILFSLIISLFAIFTTSVFGGEEVQREKFNNLRIYQVMVEAFQDGDPNRNYSVGYGPSPHHGDIKGITKALPYIKNLGMNTIWLTPIFDSDKGSGLDLRLESTGYFCRDYFKIDPAFGTLTDAREMVDRAHELGLYVLFDGVFGHHKGEVKPSPTGKLPAGANNPVDYPGSLEFYKEVATFWIDQLDIDGWRLDQAYQVPAKYWPEIRSAVETKCAERKQAGETWGTLGYLVAEIWNTAENISKQGYGTVAEPALPSAFDFPLRYNLVQALAVEENGFGLQPAYVLNLGFLNSKKYPGHALPNLMLGNHDLVRFGDLIQRAGLGGPETADYWKRHQCAFSFLTAFTGPITIYYNEEIGAEVPNFAERITQDCVKFDLCDDHVGRTAGKITGLNKNEQALYDYLSTLMGLRARHLALWNGERTNIMAGEHLYADLKTSADEAILYILNTSNEKQIFKINTINLPGNAAKDLLTAENFRPSGPNLEIQVNGLSSRFLMIKK